MSGALQVVFMNQRSFIPNPYFIGVLIPSSGDYYFNGKGAYLRANDDGMFITGGDTSARIQKLNYDGTISFQNVVTTDTNVYGQAITIPSSGNIYIAGKKDGFFNGGPWVTKFNSAGSVTWSNYFALFGFDLDGITTDSSENVYVIGKRISGDFDSANSIQIGSLNSSGTNRWQIRYGNTGSGIAGFQGKGISTYSTSVYAVGVWYQTSYVTTGVFIKLSQSNGTIEFEKRYSDDTQFFSIAQSASSGNCYIGGTANSGGAPRLILKTDSSGTKQWGSTIASDGGFTQVAIDSSENVYSITTFGSFTLVITKHNSSGTIQWQRNLTLPYQFTGYRSISVKDDGKVFIATQLYQTSPDRFYPFIALLNPDGSGTGTYTLNGQSYTYAASSYTTGTDSGSFSNSTNGKVDETRSVNAATTSSATDNLTLTRTSI